MNTNFAMEADMRSTIPSLHKNTTSSSTIRFLRLLKQPDSDPNPFELDEHDVVWSSDLSDSADPNPSFSSLSNSPTNLRHQLRQEKSGLSAALFDDHRPLVRRKPALNHSLSARMIPPLLLQRSGSGSEESDGSGSGKFHQSAPVNVPMWPKTIGSFGPNKLIQFDEEEEEDNDTEEEMLPPHVIVARSHVMTFSVFEGVGRTLKGRDLRRVRNAVFRKTGFLD